MGITRHLAFSFLASFVVLGTARADVWTANNVWDDAAEAKFGQWIKSLPMDVFSRPDSPYYGIATDCAEAVYTLRTIFSYENKLPVHFNNYEGKNLTNNNKDFDAVPEGTARLRKFINFVKAHTDTATLTADTYPIEINRTYLKAGAVFLHPESGKSVPITYRSGHVYYIQDVEQNGMIRYFSSTVPAMVRDLQTRVDIDFAPMNKTGGYRAWKRPQSGAGQPGFSEEQFTFANWRPNAYGDGDLWDAWQKVIRRRMQLRKATLHEEVEAKVENVKGYMKERNNLVQMGWRVYQSKYLRRGLKCMDDADYDDYSTPTRDVKIQSELIDLQTAVTNLLNSAQGSGQLRQDVFASYKFEVMPGMTVDANELWNTFETDTVIAISEPEHSPEVRWGLKQISIDQWPCPERRKQYHDRSRHVLGDPDPTPQPSAPFHFPWLDN